MTLPSPTRKRFVELLVHEHHIVQHVVSQQRLMTWCKQKLISPKIATVTIFLPYVLSGWHETHE